MNIVYDVKVIKHIKGKTRLPYACLIQTHGQPALSKHFPMETKPELYEGEQFKFFLPNSLFQSSKFCCFVGAINMTVWSFQKQEDKLCMLHNSLRTEKKMALTCILTYS